MKLSTDLGRLLIGAITALASLSSSSAQLPANATVYVSGLEGPRGLAFGPDGALYIAEAGTGGTVSTVGVCTQAPAPVGPYLGGQTGRISRFTAGKLSVLSTGLASTIDATGTVTGIADITFLDGQLYALVAGGGCTHGNPTLPNGVVKVNANNGRWQYITDLSTFIREHPAAYPYLPDFDPDGIPYSMSANEGHLYTVEPNHGQIFDTLPSGKTSVAFDTSLPDGHIVPTAITFRGQNLYVGNLGIFPIRTEQARILTLSKNLSFFDDTPGLETKASEIGKLRLASARAGFTSIVSICFGPDGLLYALELSDVAGYPTPGAGKVVRLKRNGVIEDVVVGLIVPTGMTFGPDKALYVSNFGAAPAGAGQILRVTVP